MLNVRVVKLGGSLLSYQDLPVHIRGWLAGQPAGATLLVAGGGLLANAVRELDQCHCLGPDASHELAVHTMRLNGLVLMKLLAEAIWVDRVVNWQVRLHRAQQPILGVLDPVPFVRDDDATLPGTALPCGWHVSSDSIAARVAEVMAADELVLLKSALPRDPGPVSYEEAAAEDYVDPHFPLAAQRRAEVRVVNLRDRRYPETVLARCAAQTR